VARALDVGTGCGIQTFHLLAHADHVTATDISPRALAFARFNLLLNAPALKLDPQNLEARVSLRQGSLLEPVAGGEFDLVGSNPPVVLTPTRPDEQIVHDVLTGTSTTVSAPDALVIVVVATPPPPVGAWTRLVFTARPAQKRRKRQNMHNNPYGRERHHKHIENPNQGLHVRVF